ncbi:Phosphoglycerate kinase [Peptoniphilus sp. ING2-D1G]|nr:Phosphoglycerate kinase [Peptoniphilus sp. ING2-D1G]
MKKNLKNFDFENKRVLIRADLNVPMKNGVITNDVRIRKSVPTIKYVLDRGGSCIIISHLGRPEGKYVAEMSLKPVAEKLQALLGYEVNFIADKEVVSQEVKEEIDRLEGQFVVLLENTRFNPAEELKGEEFSKKLCELADIYVNDAFGTSHRAHASNVGVSGCLPSAIGLLVEKEVDYLQEAVKNPKSLFVVILGGSKVSDKIGVLENLIDKADKIIIFGAMAYTFFKAKGYETGKSLVEEDKIEVAKKILKKAEENSVNIILPEDTVVTSEIKSGADYETVDSKDIPKDKMGVDIGEKSIKKIEEELKDARTVVWNGPAGVFEIEEFSRGTFEVARILSELKGAVTIVGGGDSASAVEKSGYEDKISHISTGGGASLEMLEGKELPGIACIEEA